MYNSTAQISPAGHAPSFGEGAFRPHPAPLQRRVDIYDTSGRMHGIIALAPIVYGIVQTQLGQPLHTWFWWMMIATAGFALFGRRTPYLRLTPTGIGFPEKSSEEYPWEQMCEAQARGNELDLVLADQQRITISFRKLRRADAQRVRKVVRHQFQVLAARAVASAA